MIRCQCPICAGQFEMEERWTGQSAQCPYCHQIITVTPIWEQAPQWSAPAIPPPPPLHQSPYYASSLQPNWTEANSSLNTCFLWWWLSAILGFITFGLGFIVSMVLFYVLIYKYWNLIPPNRAVTTPGKAVGFLFIPFFCIYWWWVAFVGLGKALNREIGEAQSAEVWSQIYVLSCWCSFVAWWFHPTFAFIIFVVNAISLFVMVASFQKASKHFIINRSRGYWR